MNRRYAVTAVLILLVVGIAAVGQGWAHQHGRWGVDGLIDHHLAQMAWRLDLNDSQRQQVKALVAAEKPNIKNLVQQLAATHQQMVTATQKGQFDDAKVRAIANQEAQTIAELIVTKQQLQSKVYSLLTPVQQAKFDQMQQRHLDHMQKRMETTSKP